MESPNHSQFKIREATTDDVVAIRTMHARSWQDTYPNEQAGVSEEWVQQETDSWLTPENLEKSKKFLGEIFSDPDMWYRVVVVDGELVAMVHGSKKQKQYLEALYVDKSQQGTGLAQQLMDGMMGWFDTTKPISLEVADYNDRAVRFYQKYGFEKVGNSEHLWQNVLPVIDMVYKGDRNEV